MLGVFVNVATVILGSLIGLLCKKGIPERIEKAVMTADIHQNKSNKEY